MRSEDSRSMSSAPLVALIAFVLLQACGGSATRAVESAAHGAVRLRLLEEAGGPLARRGPVLGHHDDDAGKSLREAPEARF